MLYDGLIRSIPRSVQVVIGIVFILTGLVLGALAYLTADGLMILVALVVGAPMGLVGLSLLWGEARHGNGVVSPFTLRLVGGLVAVGAAVNVHGGNAYSAFGASVFAAACFALAHQRKVARSRSW